MVLIGVGMQTTYMVVLLRLCLNLMKISQNLLLLGFFGNIWGDDFTFVIATIPWLIIIIPFLLYKSNV